MSVARRNLLGISKIHTATFTFTNHLGASLCLLNGIVEGQEVPEGGFDHSVHWDISNNFCKRVSRLGMSLCFVNGVVEDRRFLRMVSGGSYQLVQVQNVFFHMCTILNIWFGTLPFMSCQTCSLANITINLSQLRALTGYWLLGRQVGVKCWLMMIFY